MQISAQALTEFKEICRTKLNRTLTDRETYDAAFRLLTVVELMLEAVREQRAWDERLKMEPQGFSAEKHQCCQICERTAPHTSISYTRHDFLCFWCQDAIRGGVIPVFVAKNRKSWYGLGDLKSKFSIHQISARKRARTGELKARILLTPEGKPYCYVFLKKENPQFALPS